MRVARAPVSARPGLAHAEVWRRAWPIIVANATVPLFGQVMAAFVCFVIARAVALGLGYPSLRRSIPAGEAHS